MSDDEKPTVEPPAAPERPNVDAVFTKLAETYVPPAKDE
jgi:hypothetical protein